METLLIMSPRTGSRLRRTNSGVNDAGVVYALNWVPRPITIDPENPDIYATWQRAGFEIRHSGALDLLVTPIVDSVELSAQQFALTATAPGTEVRREYSGRFFAWGVKCTVRVQTVTLPAIFNIDGLWLEGAPQPKFRST